METETRDPFVSRQHVHFDMLDLLGILHNAAYLLLFERARTDFWRAHGLSKNVEGFDWPYYVAHNEIDYRAPIMAEQEVTVKVWVSDLGRSGVTFAHEIFTEEGILAAEGKTVLVRVDAETKRPTPWSEEFRALITPYRKPSR